MIAYTLDGQTFEKLSCGQCGIAFYAPQHWVEVRRDRGDHGKEFYCPNGHCRVWNTPTIDKIRQERDRLKQQTAQLEDDLREARERADKEALKAAKIKKRAEAALCPCCNRHFSQLEKHMKSKHPDVVKMPVRKLAGGAEMKPALIAFIIISIAIAAGFLWMRGEGKTCDPQSALPWTRC